MSGIDVTVWDESAAGARAVFVHGSTTWGDSAFARQRPLAADFRLELVDRRGYGRSPDVDHSDARVDADDVLGVVAGGPVHLVGHSFGTVVALLAAGAAVGAVVGLPPLEPTPQRLRAADTAMRERPCWGMSTCRSPRSPRPRGRSS